MSCIGDFIAGAIRVILFGLNFATLMTGVVLLGCGVYVKIAMNEFTDMDDVKGLEIVAYFLIAFGAVVMILSLFGCLGACLQNHVLLSLYFALMVMLLLGEVAIGVLYAVEKKTIVEEIDKTMERTVNNYGKGDTASDIAVDRIQNLLQCCGYNGPTDYQIITQFKLPSSCCADMIPNDACNTATAYKTGCKAQIEHFIASQSTIVIITVCAVVILEIVTMLAACYLRRKELKDIYLVNTPPYSM